MKLLVAFGLPLLLCAGWYIWLQNQIDLQQVRNNILEEEIYRIDKQIPEIKNLERNKQELLNLMVSYEQIRYVSKKGFIEIIPALSGLVPDGISLQRLFYLAKDGALEEETLLEGDALSEQHVQTFAEAIIANPLFERTDEMFLENSSQGTTIQFSMKLKHTPFKKPTEEEAF